MGGEGGRQDHDRGPVRGFDPRGLSQGVVLRRQRALEADAVPLHDDDQVRPGWQIEQPALPIDRGLKRPTVRFDHDVAGLDPRALGGAPGVDPHHTGAQRRGAVVGLDRGQVNPIHGGEWCDCTMS